MRYKITILRRALCNSDSLLCRFSCSMVLNCRAQRKHVKAVLSENSKSVSGAIDVIDGVLGTSGGVVLSAGRDVPDVSEVT